jgi:HK97 family phage major capsid protein
MTKEEQELMKNLEESADIFKSKAAKIDQLEKDALKNQEALDDLIIWKKSSNNQTPTGEKTFGEAFASKIESEYNSRKDEFEEFQNSKNAKLSFELKTVGNMTLSNLTGDGVATYGGRQGIIPSQKINFRDLIPSQQSPTGTYVVYRETGSEGSISQQTEGQTKSQIDYDLSEVKVVSNYVAGFAVFSKQMMAHLPFLQNTLVRMLLRDYYKSENSLFYSTLESEATGSLTSAETDDCKQVIDWIMAQQDEDFNTSFILMSNAQKGKLLKSMYDSSNYLGGGSIVGLPDGTVQIAGVPIISASWMPIDKALIIDTDFIERVETSSLRVEFSYEDSDNFRKNLVTARVECFEDLALLRTDAHALLDFGSVS